MSKESRRGGVAAMAVASGLALAALPLSLASAQPAAASTRCTAPVLQAVKAPSLVYVGGNLAVTVKLSCPPGSPVAVSLASDNSNLPVPGTVTVSSGHTSATADLTPLADSAGQYRATVTAQLGATSLNKTITVDPGLASLDLPPCGGDLNCVVPSIGLTGPAPAGGLTVGLASSNPAVTVPASVSLQQGSIGVTTNGTVSQVTVRTPVTISATLGGVTLQATKVLLPPFGPGGHIRIAPEFAPGRYIYGGEFDLEYGVLLSNPAPTGGVTLAYSSPSPSLELENTKGSVPAGSNNSFVDVDTASVTEPVHTTLVATADGVSKALPVVIEPGLASFSGLPKAIKGGRSFTGTISLAGPVDVRTAINLQATDGIMTVPGLVHIAPGHSSVSFTATTIPVSSIDDVSINASLGSTSVSSDTIKVTP